MRSLLLINSDSDYGGDLATGQSTNGVLLVRGGPIGWFTRKNNKCYQTNIIEIFDYKRQFKVITHRDPLQFLEH